MTTNHPANGPVSLDRLYQIREILSKAAAQSDGGNLGYAMADAVKVIDGAIAAFGAAPVLYAAEETLAYAKMGELHLKCLSQPMGDAVIPLYRNAQPATVSVPDAISTRQAIAKMESHEPCDSINVAYKFGWNACRSAMHQGKVDDEVGSWNNHMNTPTAKPAIDTGEPLKHIEGMEVSVDVSTCDSDAGHRYFGTVTEISELDTAKNGYILLVQDAKPNFKPAGNSPVAPDSYEDTKRLDWLDAQNKRLNEYYSTAYGWKFDANFQRNAMMLNDSNYPVMTIRQAIDEAIASAPKQENI